MKRAEAPVDLPLKASRTADFVQLTKPRITLLVLVSTFMGFYLAAPGPLPYLLLLHTIIGTALVASGAGALNQYFERELDARMVRTRTRPLPDGRIQPAEALGFSSLITVGGAAYLAAFVNPLTALLSLFTLTAYIFVYTPLKTRTWLCTLIGAIPGAIPPMMGWTAMRNALDAEAWSLFAILFAWQMPHFFAISWIFREDYERGGFSILSGEKTVGQIIAFNVALLPISVWPFSLGVVGSVYLAGALVLGLFYLGYGAALARYRTPAHAYKLLRASVLYLPLLLALMMLDKV